MVRLDVREGFGPTRVTSSPEATKLYLFCSYTASQDTEVSPPSPRAPVTLLVGGCSL